MGPISTRSWRTCLVLLGIHSVGLEGRSGNLAIAQADEKEAKTLSVLGRGVEGMSLGRRNLQEKRGRGRKGDLEGRKEGKGMERTCPLVKSSASCQMATPCSGHMPLKKEGAWTTSMVSLP